MNSGTYAVAIRDLHDFFVDWYAAAVPRDDFKRMEAALDESFEMVAPDGTRHDRDAVLSMVRESRGRDEPGTFDIDIRSVAVRWRTDDHALVRYEEWQERSSETTGRVSTVLFSDDETAPDGLSWLDLHETWIEQ